MLPELLLQKDSGFFFYFTPLPRRLCSKTPINQISCLLVGGII
jgi:hypothetical protein